MQKTALVTGGGTGLGQAIAKKLAARDIRVFIVGRRLQKLKDTQAFSPQNIVPIRADISLPKDRQRIKQALKNLSLHYVVHNAAIIAPLVPLEKITLHKFRKLFYINTEAPLFLTQLLLPYLKKNSRILHISSDCAHYPLAHFIPYCTSKAALFMLYQCLKKELSQKHISIGSVDPGMMDTPMQQYILRDDIQFPEKLSREKLKQQKLLFSPDYSANYCIKLLLDTSTELFEKTEHRVK